MQREKCAEAQSDEGKEHGGQVTRLRQLQKHLWKHSRRGCVTSLSCFYLAALLQTSLPEGRQSNLSCRAPAMQHLETVSLCDVEKD